MKKMFKKLNIDIDYEMLLKNRIPLLTSNSEWLELFGKLKDKAMSEEKTKLKAMIKQERETQIRLKAIKEEKKKLIARIITLSDEINNNDKQEHITLLDSSQAELNQLNEEIDELMFELETLPRKVREANVKLLELTVKYAYSELMEREEELGSINEDLVKLRAQLRDYITRKCDHEERVNKLYSFLHNSLGNEKLNELDQAMLK